MAGAGRQVTAIISQSGEPVRNIPSWPHWSSGGSCDTTTPHTPDSLLDSPDPPGPPFLSFTAASVAELLNTNLAGSRRGVKAGCCILSPDLMMNNSEYQTNYLGKYLNSPPFYSQDDGMEDFQRSSMFGKMAEETKDDSSISSVPSNIRQNVASFKQTYNQEMEKISVEAKIETSEFSNYSAASYSSNSSVLDISSPSARSRELPEKSSLTYPPSHSGKPCPACSELTFDNIRG